MSERKTPLTDAARNYRADVAARNARLIDLAERLERERDAAVEALRKLACLGNGDKPGNSIGNEIAIDVLAEIEGKS